MRKFHILLLLISTFAFSHTGHQADGGGKIWHFQDSELTLSGDYISSENGMVVLRLTGDLSIQEFPLEAEERKLRKFHPCQALEDFVRKSHGLWSW